MKAVLSAKLCRGPTKGARGNVRVRRPRGIVIFVMYGSCVDGQLIL